MRETLEKAFKPIARRYERSVGGGYALQQAKDRRDQPIKDLKQKVADNQTIQSANNYLVDKALTPMYNFTKRLTDAAKRKIMTAKVQNDYEL